MPYRARARSPRSSRCSFVPRPNIIVPRQSSLTLTPVRPRLRYSIGRGSLARLSRRGNRLCRSARRCGAGLRMPSCSGNRNSAYELQEVVLARERERAVRKLELDRSSLGTLELLGLEGSSDARSSSRRARASRRSSSPRRATSAARGPRGGSPPPFTIRHDLHLPRQRQHVGREPPVDEHLRVYLAGFRVRFRLRQDLVQVG